MKPSHKLISQLSQDFAQQNINFAILVENDCEGVENMSFLQYQGNEDQLEELAKLCSQVDFNTIKSNCSVFYLNMLNLISDTTATEMTHADIDLNFPPQKCTGKLILPFVYFGPNDSSQNIASKLDLFFHHQRINSYFSK